MCVHISRRTEIAKSAERPKVQGLFAENALADTHTSSRKFGALTTTDREVPNEECGSRNNHKYAVIVQDLATQWLLAYPCENKKLHRKRKNFISRRQAESLFTQTIHWSLAIACASTPHRSGTNGIAERAVRSVKEGTSAILLQSGLDETRWAGSMECYCFQRNVQDLLYDGQTQNKRRFGEPRSRPIILVGSMVLNFIRFLRKTNQDSTTSFFKEGCAQHFSRLCILRGRVWKGDIVVADVEER